MKKRYCSNNRFLNHLFLLFFLSGSLVAFGQNAAIEVLTYNIRNANPDDGPNVWDLRSEKVINLIREANPDVFGLQEALKVQVDGLKTAFPAYGFIGLGRDDGKEAGEYSPIFYKKEMLKVQSSGVFWLSQTPGVVGSRGWDAACNRVVTWAELKEKVSGKVFFAFCTHFDHIGELARRNSSLLLLKTVDSLAGKNPVVVLGDFNSVPASEPYQLITKNDNPLHLVDARLVSTNPEGPEFTWTGFAVDGQKGERIDYIFLKNYKQVAAYRVNPWNDGSYYPSDHLPVSAKLILW